MPLLVRAIINGFGWKFGFEVGRYVARRIGIESDVAKPPPTEEGEIEPGSDGPDSPDP